MGSSTMLSRYHPAQGVISRRVSTSLRRKRMELGIFAGLTLFAFWLYGPRQYIEFSESLPCRSLPGANDAVVIMKTGVTELIDRLPIHLETTLKCPPNTLIFSDHEEHFQSKYEIRDVLANIDSTLRWENEDFELYRRVKVVGREGLEPADLTGRRNSAKTTKEDKVQIAGWVLDKWKFLPMLNETFHLYPNKKWYIFIETDTYLFWTTTLKYLSTLDHTQPICLGHRSTVRSEVPFAHGGSGYIFTNPALETLVDYIQANRTELDRFVESQWAGDIALGAVLQDVGLPITPAWPIFQPHYFGTLDFGLTYEDKRYWCYPAGSFHHMTPDSIEDMWNFEREWIEEENQKYDPNTFIRYGDVLSGYLLPRMRFPRLDWDNQCEFVRSDVKTIEDCKAVCLDDDGCVQYMFNSSSAECKTLDDVRFGEASLGSGLYSDWIFDRVEEWRDDLPACNGESFILPDDDDHRLDEDS